MVFLFNRWQRMGVDLLYGLSGSEAQAMMRSLFFLSGITFFLSLVAFVIGFSNQSAVGFAGALLCGLPLFMFFFGGAFFTLVVRYRFVPKEALPTVSSPNGRRERAKEPLA
jgi:fatty acid desaturase